ncbi:MAG: M28 family peptidase [Gemmatimonadaceae bacterium]
MSNLVFRSALSLSVLALATTSGAQQAQTAAPAAVPAPNWDVLLRPRARAAAPTTAAITPADLQTRVYLFADDSLNGRELASEGNYKATEYLASEARRLGLVPMGDNGTYFQTVNMVERSLDAASTLSVGSVSLTPWTDYVVRDQGPGARSLNGVQVIYGGNLGSPGSLIAPAAASGKIVVLTVPATGPGAGLASINRGVLTRAFINSAGIVVVALDFAEPAMMTSWREPGQMLKRENPVFRPLPALLYVTKSAAVTLLGANPDSVKTGALGATVTASPRWAEAPIKYPARNVVAAIRGSDPKLRDEYVALGSHNDHVDYDTPPAPHDSLYIVNHLFRTGGLEDPAPKLTPEQQAQVNSLVAEIRRKSNGASARLDSIYNGADDDASGSMSMLEIAEYFAAQSVKPKRSLLFVWHTGEEAGLYGSEWFTDHPTVPRESIVAQINMDMIGRGGATDVTGMTKEGVRYAGGPDAVQLIGARRLSTQLGDLAEAVSKSQPRPLVIDYAMDANGHPLNIYCRSDHYEYARYGIPIVFVSTGGHADYHMVTDEPQYVDYDRLTRVSQYVADLAGQLASLPNRPVVDKPKPDPKGQCVQ